MRILVTNNQQTSSIEHGGGAIELGRGPGGDNATPRFVIEDAYVSRDQMRLEPLDGGRVRVTNLGSPISIATQIGSAPFSLEQTFAKESRELGSGKSLELGLPIRITAGYTTIDVKPGDESPEGLGGPSALQTLARPLLAARSGAAAGSASLSALGEAPSPEVLAQWLERLLQVQQASAGSSQFYDETARAVVDLIGLDRGLVLLKREADPPWETVARHARREATGPEFSRKVLAQVLSERRTFYQGLKQADRTRSLAGIEAVVASPIFDDAQDIIGVVYGSRDLDSTAGAGGVRSLEAQVVQLLAAAVSAGLARLKREADAARMRVTFEQFFSRELARALERNPKMLDGQQCEVTALFCDVRRFSQISERLGAAQTYQLLQDVMDALTDRIMAEAGVVIDYHGDGLAAMWNAPEPQPDHPLLACRAAWTMQDAMGAINQKWSPSLGFPIEIGIGLNRGPAQVGNAGSSRRLKYGPLGHTVNLASRVEGATKQFGVKVLITESLLDGLSADWIARRLCRVRVVGIHGDVALYELRPAPADDTWMQLRARHEEALSLWESGNWEEAERRFAELAADSLSQNDKACHVVLEAARATARQPDGAESVVQLTVK